MTHAQKPVLVFQRNGRVHLNRRGCQFSRLLAAGVCASAVVMVVFLDTPCSEVECKTTGYPLHSPCFPFTSPTVRHRVQSGFNWAIPDVCGYRKCQEGLCGLFAWYDLRLKKQVQGWHVTQLSAIRRQQCDIWNELLVCSKNKAMSNEKSRSSAWTVRYRVMTSKWLVRLTL